MNIPPKFHSTSPILFSLCKLVIVHLQPNFKNAQWKHFLVHNNELQPGTVMNKFMMTKWVHIARKDEDIPDNQTDNFQVSQIYDDMDDYLNDFPGYLRLPEFDELWNSV